MSISDAQAKVRAFHRKFGVACPDRIVDANAVDWMGHVRRAKWIMDEAMEIIDACLAHDFAALIDGYGDVQYFAHGGNVELGVDGAPVFDAIHNANMTKMRIPGIPKIAKPYDWSPPNIEGIIEAQRNRK